MDEASSALEDATTWIAALALLFSGLSLLVSWRSHKSRSQAEADLQNLQEEAQDLQKRELDRLTENVQILLDVHVQGGTLTLTNSADDKAHDVSVVVRTEYGRGHKRLAEPLERHNPAEVSLKDLFNSTVTYGAPAMNREESMRDIDVHVYYSSFHGNKFHQGATVQMCLSSGTYGTSHKGPGGELLHGMSNSRYELRDVLGPNNSGAEDLP